MNQIKYNAPKRQGFSSKIGNPIDRQNGTKPSSDNQETFFQFTEFPKEFNKEHLRSSDWRFLCILIFSFIFHALAIFYLFKHLPNDDEEFIIKIQNQFASRFLSEPGDVSQKEQSKLQRRLQMTQK